MITQADREAAWTIRPSCYQSHEKTKWMSGVYDEVHVIRAVARHRIAEREAVVKWLNELAGDEPIPKGVSHGEVWVLRRSAQAIAAGEHLPV